MDNTEVGRRVRQLRGMQEVDIAGFARVIGLCPCRLQNIESGATPISAEEALAVAHALDVSLDWLIRGVHSRRCRNAPGNDSHLSIHSS